MSYLVLARKYRPRHFDAMVGQEHVVQALANALNRQRLHHAYLFTGTRGVGKTTVSRILAKSLNCVGADGHGGITASPCGVCHACQDIDSGRFVDYVELDAASNRGVEEITQLLDQAVYKPVVGRFKVYMVDEVHMLSNHAFNAMLKTLEEPPEYLKFVLATTDPQKVPPTVLSRCLQFNLRPMAMATVQEHLGRVLDQESISADPGALRLLSRAARGSMRDALSLTDQAIAFSGGALTEAGVRQMLGAVDRGHAVRLLDALALGDGVALIAAADALRALGLSAAATLEEMAELLQMMAVAQAVPSAMDAADAGHTDAARLSALIPADETAVMYSLCLHGRAELSLAPDEYGGLVMVLLRMLAFRPEGARSRAMPPAREAPAPLPSSTAPAAPAAAQTAALQASTAPRATAVAFAPLAGGRRSEPATRPPRTPRGETSALPESKPEPDLDPKPDPQPSAGSVSAPMPSAEHALEPVPSAPAVVPQAAPLDLDLDLDRDRRGTSSANAGGVDSGDHTAPEDDPGAPPAWLDAPEQDGAGHEASSPSDARPPASADATRVASAGVMALQRLQPTPLGERWAATVAQLIERAAVSALVRELAWQAQCVAVVQAEDPAMPTVWRLRVERETLRAPSHVQRLEAALSDLFGSPVHVDTEFGPTSDTPALRAGAERERRQQEAEALVADDPLVRSLLSQFKSARIVPGSVRPC